MVTLDDPNIFLSFKSVRMVEHYWIELFWTLSQDKNISTQNFQNHSFIDVIWQEQNRKGKK